MIIRKISMFVTLITLTLTHSSWGMFKQTSLLSKKILSYKNFTYLAKRQKSINPGNFNWLLHRIMLDEWSLQDLESYFSLKNRPRQQIDQSNFTSTLSSQHCNIAKKLFKNNYSLNFLELKKIDSEKMLEEHLMKNIEPFLECLGGHFWFVRSQYRIEQNGTTNIPDIVLYAPVLKCFVIVELKITSLNLSHVHQLQRYIKAFDKQYHKGDAYGQTIGLLLGPTASNDFLARFLSSSDDTEPISIATFNI